MLSIARTYGEGLALLTRVEHLRACEDDVGGCAHVAVELEDETVGWLRLVGKDVEPVDRRGGGKAERSRQWHMRRVARERYVLEGRDTKPRGTLRVS